MDKSSRRFKSDNSIVALRDVTCVAERCVECNSLIIYESEKSFEQKLKQKMKHKVRAQHNFPLNLTVFKIIK